MAKVVRGRRDFHNAMRRNGWLLPALTQPLCTLDFMQQARAGKVFCPRVEMVRRRPVCVAPPPNTTLIAKVRAATEAREAAGLDCAPLRRLLARLHYRQAANQAFLVLVLHVLEPADEIFRPDYLYLRHPRQ